MGRAAGTDHRPWGLLLGEIMNRNHENRRQVAIADRWNLDTQAVGEIMKADTELWSLTGGILTPKRLLIGEIM